MSEETFRIAVDEVLRHERGYVDDPRDPGGPTNLGISLRFATRVGDLDADGRPDLDVDGDGDVDSTDIRLLSVAQVVELYRLVFWRPLHADDLPPPIALALFDTAVNMGRGPAVILLQRAAGVTTDGKLGPITLRVVAASQDVPGLLARFTVGRLLRYANLDRFDTYGRGWFRRAVEIDRAALRLERSP